MRTTIKETTFWLPEKGSLSPNHVTDDPLRFYYHPVVGKLYVNRINHVLSLLSPPYERILEVGYGSGILFPTLSKITRSIAGIDIKSPPPDLVENLRKLGVTSIQDLRTGELSTCGFGKEEFDLVIAISIFEHIKNPLEMLQEIHRILKPNGSLLVGMPRVDMTMAALFKLIGFPNIGDHHVTTYQQFLKFTEKYFTVSKFKKLAPFKMSFFPLYFSMLLKKI